MMWWLTKFRKSLKKRYVTELLEPKPNEISKTIITIIYSAKSLVSHLLPAKIPLHPFLSMRSFYILFIVAESSLAISSSVGTLVAEPFSICWRGREKKINPQLQRLVL